MSRELAASEPQVQNSSPLSIAVPAPVILHQTSEQSTSVPLSISSTLYSLMSPYSLGETESAFDDGPPASRVSSRSSHGLYGFCPNTAGPNITEAVLALSDGLKDVFCIHPGIVTSNRYDQRPARSKRNSLTTIPPLTFSFEEDELPCDWVTRVHPDGQSYFYKDIDHSRRYITQAYLHDKDTLIEIHRFCQFIEGCLNNETRKLPEKFEIVLDLQPDWDAWGYYMIDHASRCIFWLEELDVHWAIGEEFDGIQLVSQMKYWIEESYWKHWDLFPPEFLIPQGSVNHLWTSLLHGNIDTMTSLDSTMPWTTEEMRTIMDVIKKIDVIREIQDPACNQHINAAIGRILWFQAHERFFNFFGQHGSRLERGRSVYGDTRRQKTFLFTMLSPLLYGGPRIHLQKLEKLWTDKMVFGKSWRRYVENLKGEWKELIIGAIVFLNANVAFLAIPLLSPGANSAQTISDVSSPSQICSLLSILASMGCLIFGLVLFRHHQQGAECAEFAAAYLSKHSSERFGLEPLAIMYSLPYGFFAWALVTFLGAITLLCFFEIRNLSQRIIISMAWLVLLVVFIWVIQRNWKSGGNYQQSSSYNNGKLQLGQDLEDEDEDD